MESLPNTSFENKSDRVETSSSSPAASIYRLLPSGSYSTRLIYLILLGILFFLIIGIIARFYQVLNAQQENLLYRHQKTLLVFEAKMKSAIDTVEGLRASAEAYYLNPGTEPSPYYKMLVSRPDRGGYALERILPPFSQDQLANLTGLGELERNDASFRREIDMALSLTPLFRWAKDVHPTTPWVYYTSKRDFISMYPWVSADDFFFTPATSELEFFTGGLPENNPDRRLFITEVYLDQAGQGLMVTIAAPVYEDDTFRGTVALDFTLDWLNNELVQPHNPGEKALIVNDRGQIVAISSATTTIKTTLGIADALPELGQDTATLLSLPPGQVNTLGQYYVFVSPIQNTPWTYVAAAPQSSILFQVIKELFPIILMALLCIVGLVFIRQRARQESKLHALEARRLAQEQEAQAELLREKNFSNAVINSLPGVFYIYDTQGRLRLWNKNHEQVTGYSAEEMATLNALDEIAEEDKDSLAGKVIEVFAGQAIMATEARILTKSGEKIPYYFTGLRLNLGEEVYLVGVGLDLTAQKQAEAERDRLQQEIIETQQQAIAKLSTPVIPVMERIIVMPLIGSIDSIRARNITRSLLAGISQYRTKVVILDVTGVEIMDADVVNHLSKTIQAARLKGARTIVTGVSDAIAEIIVDLGIDWGDVATLGSLQMGLLAALDSLGYNIEKVETLHATSLPRSKIFF